MSNHKNKNVVSIKKKTTQCMVTFALFALTLFLPHQLTAQHNVIAKKEATICKNNTLPINLNKVLGINLSLKAGSWYNASGEKASNIFVFPTSSNIGDLFEFYFLVEAKDVYCGLNKNDRYNVALSISGVVKPEASVTLQPTCEVPTGTITVTSPKSLGSNERYVLTGVNPTVEPQKNTTGVFRGLDSGDYTVQVENTLTECISEPLSLTVKETPSDCPDSVFKIPQGFSPNGDGINDTFEVLGLASKYPNFTMQIYSRWGSLVYKYSNKGRKEPKWWDGYYSVKSTTPVIKKGERMPAGTYFYIIEANYKSKKIFKGWVYLNY